MPEIARFFGIIIRMYAEPGAPHHRPHFHAYYQDDVAVYAIDNIELIGGRLPGDSDVWSRRGQSCISKSCTRIGSAYREAARRPESLHCSEEREMIHPIYRVTSLKIVAPYTIRVAFDDGTSQTIDFEPVLAGELYGPLRDLRLFNQVAIDPEVQTLVWPNGADFDPATLHDWPEHLADLEALTEEWARAAA